MNIMQSISISLSLQLKIISCLSFFYVWLSNQDIKYKTSGSCLFILNITVSSTNQTKNNQSVDHVSLNN